MPLLDEALYKNYKSEMKKNPNLTFKAWMAMERNKERKRRREKMKQDAQGSQVEDVGPPYPHTTGGRSPRRGSMRLTGGSFINGMHGMLGTCLY